jgi:Mg2+ and Co2+ transporter CorA
MDVTELLDKKQEYIESINNARYKIAELRKILVDMKAPLWEEATGTVDAKKDYIKSQTSDIQKQIDEFEADIEWYYNMLQLVDDKLLYSGIDV